MVSEMAVSTLGTLVKKVNKFRIDEQKEANADPDLNFLARYPGFLEFIHQLLGDEDTSPRASPELFQPETLAHVVEETRCMLHELLGGPTGRAAVGDVQAYGLRVMSKEDRRALGPGAFKGVGELAVRDAILAGVAFWLHDVAQARKTRAPRAKGEPRSDEFRKLMSERATASWQKRKAHDDN